MEYCYGKSGLIAISVGLPLVFIVLVRGAKSGAGGPVGIVS